MQTIMPHSDKSIYFIYILFYFILQLLVVYIYFSKTKNVIDLLIYNMHVSLTENVLDLCSFFVFFSLYNH